METIYDIIILCQILICLWLWWPIKEPEPLKPALLFLDDERNPEDVTWVDINYDDYDVVVVRTYAEFVAYIESNELPYAISLDHDIQDFNHGDEKTGYDCVKFFCNHFMNEYDDVDIFPEMVYHTNNPVGKQNMSTYVENCKSFIK